MFAATILFVHKGAEKAMEIARVLRDLGIEVRIVPQITDSKSLESVASSWTSLDFAICVSSASMCIHLLKDIVKMPFDPGVVAVSPRGSVAIPLMNCGLGGARALCKFLERKGVVKKCIDTSYAYEENFVNFHELPFILRMDIVERWKKLHSVLLDVDRGVEVRVYSFGRMLKTLKELRLPPNTQFVDSCSEADVCILPALSTCEHCNTAECGLLMKARPLVLAVCVSSRDFDESSLHAAIKEVLDFFGIPIPRLDYTLASNDRVLEVLERLGFANPSVEIGCNVVEMLRNRWKRFEILLSYRVDNVHVCMAEVGLHTMM